MKLSLILILFLFAVVNASFYDTTCPKYRSTLAEVRERNYAKSLGFGNFTCVGVYYQYKSDGSLNLSFPLPNAFQTFYDHVTGAILTTPPGIPNVIVAAEYSGHDGSTCIDEPNNPNFSGFYTESYDISKGGRRNAARLIQSYEKNSRKQIRRVQHLIPTSYGELLFLEYLDENQHLKYVVTLTCNKINNLTGESDD